MPADRIMAVPVQIDVATVGLHWNPSNLHSFLPNLCQKVSLREGLYSNAGVFVCTSHFFMLLVEIKAPQTKKALGKGCHTVC